MPNAEPSLPSGDVIRIRPPSRSVRYLLHARKESCGCCPSGSRVVSLWVTGRGSAEELSWCDRCFNAYCELVELPEAHRPRYAAIRASVARRRPTSPPWPAARQALVEAERRGLL